MSFKEIKENITAIIQASKSEQFLNGVQFDLPEIGAVTIKAQAPVRSMRPKGLKWNQFSYITRVSASNNITASGFGESNNQLLALQKSIIEGVERVVFRSLKSTNTFQSISSNGWAAHLSIKKANHSALMELLERDAVLMHWLSKTPLLELPKNELPKNILNWVNTTLIDSDRFKSLRILVSTLGKIPTVTTILTDEQGFSVLSHATSNEFQTAIDKAIAETCRIAHLTYKNQNIDQDLSGPEDHALYYATNERLPDFIFGESITLKNAIHFWNKKIKNFDPDTLQIKYQNIKCGDVYISRAMSPCIQDLFFGNTDQAIKNDLINLRRLTEVMSINQINLMPHFVP